MPDPFDELRLPLTPSEPDPAFVNRLRARVRGALTPPRGASMSDLDTLHTTDTPATDGPPMQHGDLGYSSVQVPDVARAADFFAAVLGWDYDIENEGQSRQTSLQSLHQGLWGGVDETTLLVCYKVDDITDAVRRVRAAGGTAEEPSEAPYGLVSACTDDQGFDFVINQPPAEQIVSRRPLNGERQGDISYLTLEVRDSAKARAFFGAVFGWVFSPGRIEDGWGIDNTVPMAGLSGGHDRALAVPMYLVDDIAAAVAAVRSHGGTATDPEQQPYGVSATCTDDQGTRFYLGQR